MKCFQSWLTYLAIDLGVLAYGNFFPEFAPYLGEDATQIEAAEGEFCQSLAQNFGTYYL